MKPNKMWRFIFLLFFFYFFCFSQIITDYQEKKLNVIPIAQEQPMWCWAASGQMIMAFFNQDVPQNKQIDDFLNLDEYEKIVEEFVPPRESPATYAYSGTSDYDPNEVPGLPPVMPDFSRYGFRSNWGGALEWDILVNEIENNRPFGFSWVYASGSGVINESRNEPGGGHYMVAIGYKKINREQWVWIIDPTKLVTNDGEVPINPELIRYDEYREYNDEQENKYWYTHYIDQYEIIKPEQKRVTSREPILNSDTTETNPGFKNPKTAVRTQLERLKNFNQEFSKVQGFESERELLSCSLGNLDRDYYEIYMVGIGDIKNIEKLPDRKDLKTILIDLKQRIYPIYSFRKVKTSITIRKKPGNWHLSAIGGQEIHVLEQARRSAFSILRSRQKLAVLIPAMRIIFLGYEDSSGTLQLIPTHNHPDYTFPLHIPISAEEVFLELKNKVIRYQNMHTPLSEIPKIK